MVIFSGGVGSRSDHAAFQRAETLSEIKGYARHRT